MDVEPVEHRGDHEAAEVVAEGPEHAVVGVVLLLPLEHPLGVHKLAVDVSIARHKDH